MSLETSAWSPSRAASAFFDLSRGRDPLAHAREALLPVCGPGGTETLLHTALVNNQNPNALVEPLCGKVSHSRIEMAILAAAPAVLVLSLVGTWLGSVIGRFQGFVFQASISMAIAYAFAVIACVRIALAVRGSRELFWAWMLFAASSAVSIGRHLFEAPALVPFWLGSADNPALGFRQFPIVGALLLFFAGLLVLSEFFRKAGLGWQATISDYGLIAVLMVVVPVTFELRGSFSDAGSPYGFVRLLQSLSPFLLAAVAVPAVLLHRISYQLSGGGLSGVLQLIVCFIYVRLWMLLVNCFFDAHTSLLVRAPIESMHSVPAWLFALAAVQQWRLLVKAS